MVVPPHFCCVQVGDLVYARVESAHRDLEPVLSCTDAAGKVSGEPATKELARRRNPSCAAPGIQRMSVHNSSRNPTFFPMLTCLLPTPPVAQASGFAHLKGGMVFEVSTTHARSLLRCAVQARRLLAGWPEQHAELSSRAF